jgi:hypothetical protein
MLAAMFVMVFVVVLVAVLVAVVLSCIFEGFRPQLWLIGDITRGICEMRKHKLGGRKKFQTTIPSSLVVTESRPLGLVVRRETCL